MKNSFIKYLNKLETIIKKAVELSTNLKNYTKIVLKPTNNSEFNNFNEIDLYKWNSDVVALYINHWNNEDEKIVEIPMKKEIKAIIDGIYIYFSPQKKRMLLEITMCLIRSINFNYIQSSDEFYNYYGIYNEKIKRIIKKRILKLFPDFTIYDVSIKNICSYFCWSKNHCRNFLTYLFKKNTLNLKCDIINQKHIPEKTRYKEKDIPFNNWRGLEKYYKKITIKF